MSSKARERIRWPLMEDLDFPATDLFASGVLTLDGLRAAELGFILGRIVSEHEKAAIELDAAMNRSAERTAACEREGRRWEAEQYFLETRLCAYGATCHLQAADAIRVAIQLTEIATTRES